MKYDRCRLLRETSLAGISAATTGSANITIGSLAAFLTINRISGFF